MAGVHPAADAHAADREPGTDWVDQLYARSPFSTWGTGVAIALGLAALYLAATAATGELAAFLERGGNFLTDRNARLGILLPILAAYVPSASRALSLASRQNLAALERATGVRAPPLHPLPYKGLAIGLALLLQPLAAGVVDRATLLYFEREYWTAATVSNWVLGVLLCLGMARFGHATLAWSRTFSDAAGQLERVDLFDREWLTPFARQALLCALLWLVIPTLFAVNLGDAPFQIVALPLTLGCLGVGCAALWLPTKGVRQRLLDARSEELTRVHRALRGDRQAAGALAVRGSAEPTLADLLAYERFLRDVPSSPFDQASWIRIALLLALPLGSWLGGAVVERLLGLVLD